jgi:hypothetical protein
MQFATEWFPIKQHHSENVHVGRLLIRGRKNRTFTDESMSGHYICRFIEQTNKQSSIRMIYINWWLIQ